ncbi:hypothetical protein [Diatraea saccharalis granulovirus]|uniref:Uncharacterized protein n=1 Tax=Diatraea saccharalis granulovirus TaxID=1675862 RepID=A0A0R7EYS7_9BBAC|nr:hypothetical protein [Diatraea saccharalis granulovirus]AKN80745.1 hypothetical protein [Diatraea saccharalis granulovirus]
MTISDRSLMLKNRTLLSNSFLISIFDVKKSNFAVKKSNFAVKKNRTLLSNFSNITAIICMIRKNSLKVTVINFKSNFDVKKSNFAVKFFIQEKSIN